MNGAQFQNLRQMIFYVFQFSNFQLVFPAIRAHNNI